MPYLFFSPRYRGSKSAVIFNSDEKHRAHNFRRYCISRNTQINYYVTCFRTSRCTLQTMYTHWCAGALCLLVYKCNSLIFEGFFQSQKKSFISKTIFVLHLTDEFFFNSETILLIDKRNLLNFNGFILKGT